MTSKACKCGDPVQHALAVSTAILQSLFSAGREPAREEYWRAHADKLETMFATQHGRHYSEFLGIRR